MPVLRLKGKSDIYVYTVEPQPTVTEYSVNLTLTSNAYLVKYHQNFYKIGTGHQF